MTMVNTNASADSAAISTQSTTEDGFDEAELQAALNMSMHQDEVNSNRNAAVEPTTVQPPTQGSINTSAAVDPIEAPEIILSSHPLESIDEFRKLMFNDAIATVGDKERWIYECIATPSDSSADIHHGNNSSSSNSSQSPKSNLEMLTGHSHIHPNQQVQFNNHANQEGDNNIDAKPAAIPDPDDSMHKLWGLTQKHGGPCGVLAAIQAEMIRILLFGREFTASSPSNDDGDDDVNMSNTVKECRLFYPFYASQDKRGTHHSITSNQVRESLAMAMGMILARASMMPCASLTTSSDNVVIPDESYSVSLVFPEEEKPISGQTDGNHIKSANGDSGWIAYMLNNADPTSSNGGSETKSSLGLRVDTITCPKISDIVSSSTQLQSLESNNDNNEDEDDASPESKRRKKKEVTFASSSDGSHIPTSNNPISPDKLTLEEIRQQKQMSLLARGVADYLLGRTTNSSSSNNNTNSTTIPLDYYSGPGGIMYFVMGLMKSRGVDTIKTEMDDPNTTITSQFGHSSQELINLLLTGQAVSNVFDNSMTLSGELTCRGIQQRPAIGYLSQLESLHYCEVGGYYKSPLFPVWVVGSTSHFSVLFGGAACLQESQSDLILEKCRRAFKNAEDGGESGFILVGKLGVVVDELNLRQKLGGDNGVQTLQAFLEVSGAGIILWEDAWKSLSRIMMGSTLESVIDSSHAIPSLSASETTAASTAASTTTSTMQSDEELAKRLAEEWETNDANLEVARYATTSSNHAFQTSGDNTAESDEAFARALQAQWDSEVMDNNSNDAGDDTKTNAACADVADIADWQDLDYDKSQRSDFSRSLDPSDDEGDAAFEQKYNKVVMECIEREVPEISMRPPTPPIQTIGGTHKSSDFPSHHFEQYGPTFPLYHYNGLRGGTLTPFRVARLNAAEAVGSSIGLTSGLSNHHGSGDLEAVVRTKWPSCTFDWLGKNAPYID